MQVDAGAGTHVKGSGARPQVEWEGAGREVHQMSGSDLNPIFLKTFHLGSTN